MSGNDNDIELCEQYLDRELAAVASERLESRLATEPSLRQTLDRLRQDRSVRLEAMSTAFDVDAAAVERLIASVRQAQSSEQLGTRARRTWWSERRPWITAAASVAFGLFVGGLLQGRQSGRWTATPASTETPSAIVGNSVNFGDLNGHGAYAVSLVDGDGKERLRVRCHTPEQARQFIDSINHGNAAGVSAVGVGDARLLDESY